MIIMGKTLLIASFFLGLPSWQHETSPTGMVMMSFSSYACAYVPKNISQLIGLKLCNDYSHCSNKESCTR